MVISGSFLKSYPAICKCSQNRLQKLLTYHIIIISYHRTIHIDQNNGYVPVFVVKEQFMNTPGRLKRIVF